MRTTDHRYRKEQAKLNLAISMIGLNARTSVIRDWTGLSNDRIRKLIKYYGVTTQIHPHRFRGRSPSACPATSRNAETRQQAHLLCGLFTASGLMHTHKTNLNPPQILVFGQEFCRTYEWFLKMEGEPAITFEHAYVLWQQLVKGHELSVVRCRRCQLLLVSETYKAAKGLCDHCSRLSTKRLLNS